MERTLCAQNELEKASVNEGKIFRELTRMKKQIVPSGSYVISQGKAETLEAYLGTCVGVTLSDSEARLGGLLHVLLPEPTGSDYPFSPEIYAVKGLPLFLDAFYKAGGTRENVIASIAGGALIGPVSEQDVSLDIGGRTTDIVLEILREKKVKVNHMETGGVFGCRISLDLSNFNTTVAPLCPPDHPSCGLKTVFSKSEIDKAIESVQPIPQIALRIVRMLRKEDYNMKEIAAEIVQDQIISAKVINLCNSALIGLRNRIDSIDRALVTLGEKRLLQMVVRASLETLFPASAKGYSLCKGGIFHHAVGTATLANEISLFTGKSSPDTAYTAGLLHDIGKIPLDQYLAQMAPLFYRTVQEEGEELCKLEKEHFGISHTEAGEVLAIHWNLPGNLVDVIGNHHQPDQALVDPELVNLIYLADLIISRFQVGNVLERLNTDNLSLSLEKLGLSRDQFSLLVARMPPPLLETGRQELS
jgi:putative nucleotidyltransferase with HDIG domain